MRNVLITCCFPLLPLPSNKSSSSKPLQQQIRQSAMRPIALITDFHTADHFVGSMKGVIASMAAHSPVFDICHEIAAGDTDAAAFMLRMCYRDFPHNTIFVAVVDPGVGSKRNPVAIRCGSNCFIGPDNGVLDCVARHAGIGEIRTITNKLCFREPLSTTFHGRDVFAPAAARIAAGMLFADIGPVQTDIVPCTIPPVQCTLKTITGTIAHIDCFGNCITTIEAAHIAQFAGKTFTVTAGNADTGTMANCYADAAPQAPLAIIGSADFLEICVNNGNAAQVLGLTRGDTVVANIS